MDVIFIELLIALVIALPTFKPAQLVQFLGLSSVAVGFAFRDPRDQRYVRK